MKILFVAMDRGGYRDKSDKPFDLASTQKDFREAAENRINANAHMGGVHLLMRKLVDEKNPSAFAKQFALTNAVKCRRVSESMRATTHHRIVSNCSDHLRAEIEMLQPTLIITQGAHPSSTVRDLKPFCGAENRVVKFSNGDARNRGEAVVVYSGECILLTTPHPARLKGLKWKKGQGELPRFLNDAVNRIRRDIARGIL